MIVENNRNITNAQYTTSNNTIILAIVDGIEVSIPTDPANSDYAEILRQVEAGTLTIADAEL